MSIAHIVIITPLLELHILFENILDHAGDYLFLTYFDEGCGFINIVVLMRLVGCSNKDQFPNM